MPIAKIIKQPSDLITTTTVAPLNTGSDTAAVALLRRGTDATESVLLVHDPEEMPDAGFDETTEEYALVEAMFDVKNFKGPVMIGTYPNTDVISLNDVSVTPTADGATLSATVSGVQKWLEDHLNDGPRWFIPVGMTDDDIKTAADIMYANAHSELVLQVDNIVDLQKWHDYAVATQTDKDKLGHLRAIVEKSAENKPAAQAVAYASTLTLLDWMRIGNLSQFVPNDWTQVERDMIENLNGLTVVNKADDLMLSADKELNGNYIDNSFNAQFNTDFLRYRIQKWMNSKNFTEITDDNISELVTTAQAAGDDLFKLGTIATGDDGKADFHVTAKSRSQLSAYEVSQRKYKSLDVQMGLPNPFEKVYLNNAITL